MEKTMLKWRCVSACARVVCPDVIGGLYLAEEIEAHSDVQDTMGQIEQASQIAADPSKYEDMRQELMANVEAAVKAAEKPFDIKRISKQYRKEIASLSSGDRSELEKYLDGAFSAMVRGEAPEAPVVEAKAEVVEEGEKPKRTVKQVYDKCVEECKNADQLIKWFRTEEPGLRKDFNEEEFTKLVGLIKGYKAQLVSGKKPAVIKKTEPEAVVIDSATQDMIDYVSEAEDAADYQVRLSEAEKQIQALSPEVQQEVAGLLEVMEKKFL